MFERNKLVPELMVTHLDNSLAFWVSCLGFSLVALLGKERAVSLP